jgi:CBS domain-containing protein
MTTSLAHVRVGDAMHQGITSCSAETPLRGVARLLATKRIHCVAVADHPPANVADWAVVSDLDLVTAAATDDLDSRTAGEIAATEALVVSAAEPLQRAAQLMAEHQVAHLLVVDAAGGRPVGVLSTLDVAGLLAGSEAS